MKVQIKKELADLLRVTPLSEDVNVSGTKYTVLAKSKELVLVAIGTTSYLLFEDVLVKYADENRYPSLDSRGKMFICGYKDSLWQRYGDRELTFCWAIPEEFEVDFDMLAVVIVAGIHRLCEDGMWGYRQLWSWQKDETGYHLNK